MDDDDVLGLEAGAPVKAARRAAHRQQVHDCRILLRSDNLSIVLCLSRGPSQVFQAPGPDQTPCIRAFGLQHQNQGLMDTKRIQPTVRRAAENRTAHLTPPKVSETTSAQEMVGRSRLLPHALVMTPPTAKPKRSRHRTLGPCQRRLPC